MRISRKRRAPEPVGKTYRVNEQINVPEVRVIDDAGAMLGLLRTADAIRQAQEKGFDLVEINPKAEPPVCRILNFGHFKYQKEKEARKQKTHAHVTEVKGVRLSIRIGEHDLEIRKQQGIRFLERGDKLKVELMMKGRERAFRDRAEEVVKNFIAAVNKDLPVRVDQPVTAQGPKIFAVIART